MSFNDFANKYILGGPATWPSDRRKEEQTQQNQWNNQAQAEQNKFIAQQNKNDQDFVKWQMSNNMLYTADQYKQLGINPTALAGSQGTVTPIQGTPQGATANQVPHNATFTENLTGAIGTAMNIMNLRLLSNQNTSLELDNQYKQYQVQQIGAITTPVLQNQGASAFENKSISSYGTAVINDQPGEKAYRILKSEDMKNRTDDDFLEQIFYGYNLVKDGLIDDKIKKMAKLPEPTQGFSWIYGGDLTFREKSNKLIEEEKKSLLEKGKELAKNVKQNGYIGGYK